MKPITAKLLTNVKPHRDLEATFILNSKFIAKNINRLRLSSFGNGKCPSESSKPNTARCYSNSKLAPFSCSHSSADKKTVAWEWVKEVSVSLRALNFFRREGGEMEALLFFKLLFAASWSRRRQARAQMSGLTTAEVWRSFNHRVRRLRSWEVLVRVDVWAVEWVSSLGDEWVWFDVNIWGTSSCTSSTTCLEVGAGVRYSKASSLPSPSSLEIVRSTNSEILELEEVWVGLAGGGEKSGRKGSSTIRICLSLKPDVLPGGDWVRS